MHNLREKAILLRKEGHTYTEIQRTLGARIPKSTLTYWCRSIILPQRYHQRVRKLVLQHIGKARLLAVAANREKRSRYLDTLRIKNKHLKNLLKKKDIAKIALAMLYWGEGSKTRHGSLLFGNSDSRMIKMFLILLRTCYTVDSNKLRCTVQCRADQNIKANENFWSEITGIPRTQFLKAQVDPRTRGKKTKNQDYKGVCRIDYYSGQTYNDLLMTIQVLNTGL